MSQFKKSFRILAVAATLAPAFASTFSFADHGFGNGNGGFHGDHEEDHRFGPPGFGGPLPPQGGPGGFHQPGPPGFGGPHGPPFIPPGHGGPLPPQGGPGGFHPPGGPGGFPGHPPVIVHVPPRVPGHCYTPPPLDQGDEDEIEATRLLAGALHARTCDRAGDVLREMANLMLSSAKFAQQPGTAPGSAVIIREGEREEEARQRWRAHFDNGRFLQIVWSRLAQMYRECNKTCFDDGVAVGQISATGYCSASIAVNGLNAPGFQSQGALPLCQNETFTGCLVGYDQTSSTFQGCSTYTTGGYAQIYNQSKSQDCHIDP